MIGLVLLQKWQSTESEALKWDNWDKAKTGFKAKHVWKKTVFVAFTVYFFSNICENQIKKWWFKHIKHSYITEMLNQAEYSDSTLYEYMLILVLNQSSSAFGEIEGCPTSCLSKFSFDLTQQNRWTSTLLSCRPTMCQELGFRPFFSAVPVIPNNLYSPHTALLSCSHFQSFSQRYFSLCARKCLLV